MDMHLVCNLYKSSLCGSTALPGVYEAIKQQVTSIGLNMSRSNHLTAFPNQTNEQMHGHVCFHLFIFACVSFKLLILHS